jgi:hypothetical protein
MSKQMVEQSKKPQGSRLKAEKQLEVVDSVRSREPSPCGIAFGYSILPVPNEQDSTSSG